MCGGTCRVTTGASVGGGGGGGGGGGHVGGRTLHGWVHPLSVVH